MRITFIMLSFSNRPIGGYKVVYEYANCLASRGHDVSLVHPHKVRGLELPRSYYSRTRMRINNLSASILRPQRPRWQPLDPRVQLLHVPEAVGRCVPDADVVIATAWQTAKNVVGYPSSKGEKHYLVMDFYPWLATREVLEDTWRLPLRKVTISSALFEMVRKAGVGKEEVVNIPIGVEPARFRMIQGLESRRDSVAMLYSKASYKASEHGVEALEICRAQYPDLEAVLFGPSYRRKGIPAWMTYRGNISEAELIDEVYNGSRIYLCSSLFEGFGLPVAEAMACGCAVVSTDCGGVREFASHEETAMLSPPGAPDMLAHNLLRVLGDDGLRMRLARAGCQKIQEFNWNRATEMLERHILS